MPKLLKKSLILFLTLIFFLSSCFFLIPKAQAVDTPIEQGIENVWGVGPWYNQSLGQFYLKVHDPSNPTEIFGERYTWAQVDWIIWSVLWWLPSRALGTDLWSCIFNPGDVGTCIEALFASDNQPAVLAAEDNSTLVERIFQDRPLSGVTYVKNSIKNFHLLPESKAQTTAGFGFNALDPILGFWQASRNIAYAFFVIIILVMAFMIMFRVKISPQVVITVQSALPRLVIALILVTFSYAIAGFLVDLMYVVIGLVSLLGARFLEFEGAGGAKAVFDFMTRGYLPGLTEGIAATAGAGFQFLGVMGLFVVYIFLFTLAAAFVFINTVGGATVFAGLGAAGIVYALGAIFAAPIAATMVVLLAILFLVILLVTLIVIIVMCLKTIWALTLAYTKVLLLTIFAPFQIALGAVVPNFGFSRWLKSFVSALAVFVVAGALFFLSFLFLYKAVEVSMPEGSSIGENLGQVLVGKAWLGNETAGWPPLIGGVEGMIGFLLLGVSLTIFFAIPKTAKLIEAIIQGQPFAYGAAIGQALQAGIALPQFFAGRAIGTYTGAMEKAYQEQIIGRAGQVAAASGRGFNFMDFFRRPPPPAPPEEGREAG